MIMNTYESKRLTTDHFTEELIYNNVRLGITMEQLGDWSIITGLDSTHMLLETYRSKLEERRDERLDDIL